MPKYLLQTLTGLTPPKFVHDDIDLATAEAKRLHEKFDTQVLILKIVGVVRKEPIPVTEMKTKVTMFDSDSGDDLPF